MHVSLQAMTLCGGQGTGFVAPHAHSTTSTMRCTTTRMLMADRYKIEIENTPSNPGSDVSFRDSLYMTMRVVESALLRGVPSIKIIPEVSTTESEFEEGPYGEDDLQAEGAHPGEGHEDGDPGASDRDLPDL